MYRNELPGIFVSHHVETWPGKNGGPAGRRDTLYVVQSSGAVAGVTIPENRLPEVLALGLDFGQEVRLLVDSRSYERNMYHTLVEVVAVGDRVGA